MKIPETQEEIISRLTIQLCASRSAEETLQAKINNLAIKNSELEMELNKKNAQLESQAGFLQIWRLKYEALEKNKVEPDNANTILLKTLLSNYLRADIERFASERGEDESGI